MVVIHRSILGRYPMMKPSLKRHCCLFECVILSFLAMNVAACTKTLVNREFAKLMTWSWHKLDEEWQALRKKPRHITVYSTVRERRPYPDS